MSDRVRSLFTDEEWKLLTEADERLCYRAEALPLSGNTDKERICEANESIAVATTK